MGFSLTSLLMVFLLLMGQPCEAWQMPPHRIPGKGADMGMMSNGRGNCIAVIDNQGTIEAYYSIKGEWTKTPEILGKAYKYGYVDASMNSRGHGLAMWTSPKETLPKLYSSFFNGLWTNLKPIQLNGNVRTFTLEMNDSGSALAVWIDDATSSLYSCFFSNYSWGDPIVIAPSNGEQLSVAYSANGTAVIGYVNGSSGYAVNYIDGAWQTPVTLQPEPHLCDHNIVVGIDERGKALAVWMGTEIWEMYARSFDGSTWHEPTVISGPYRSNLCFGNSLAMTPSGRAVFTWTGDDLNRYPFCGYSNSYDGTSWGTTQQFSFNNALFSDVTVNSNGDALLLFYFNKLQSARLPFGGVWTKPEVISQQNDYSGYQDTWSLMMAPFLSDDGFATIGWAIGSNQSLQYYSTSEE